jgi:RNA polymerase subunit RPABC4/transcription elongation factor Spt4
MPVKPKGKKMGFPIKFKELLEIEKKDVEKPEEAWLTYAVCATEQNSCGWGGWMLEAVWKKTSDKRKNQFLTANDEEVCPRCGRETYRTGASYRFVISPDQTPIGAVPGVDFEITPIEFED